LQSLDADFAFSAVRGALWETFFTPVISCSVTLCISLMTWVLLFTYGVTLP
jgi:hypothetical protein